MFRPRSGATRVAVAVLALFLAPLLVAAESWHTCTLAGGEGRGVSRIEPPASVRTSRAHSCLACSLTRQVFPSMPVPVPGGPDGRGRSTVPAASVSCTRAPVSLLPPGRAPPA